MPDLRRATQARTAVAVTSLVLLTGCAADDEPQDATSTASASEPTAQEPAAEVDIPDTAVGRAARWTLEQLAAESGPTADEAAARFAPVFLDQVPPAQVGTVFAQVRASGPFTPTSYAEHGTSGQAELTGGNGRLLLSVFDDDERIQGLFFQPLPAIPEISGPEQAAEEVAAAAEHAAFLLAEVDDSGQCVPVAASEADQLGPIGSIFKLYVLGAVVDAVADGDLAWSDTVTLTEEMRSLPSGTLQAEPAGTEVTVREAAEMMIAISDNTATDLLIAAVGRDRVEQALTDLGHATPEVNVPFLTTREMFQLSLTDPSLRAEWAAATGGDPLSPDPGVSERQRGVVEALPAWDLTVDEALATSPAWPAGLDWFATAEDLCAAHVGLQELADTPAGEPVRDILAANPGVASTAGFAYVGFEGGSAVGEIAGSWYTRAPDGDRHVSVIQLADDADPAGVPDAGWLGDVAAQTLATLDDR